MRIDETVMHGKANASGAGLRSDRFHLRFELLEVDADGFLHGKEDWGEHKEAPLELEDCSAEDATAFLFGNDAKAPLGRFEVAGVASGADELDGAATDGIDFGNAVGHLAPCAVRGVGARVGVGVELEADALRSTGGSQGAGDAAIPYGDVGHVAEIGPHILRGAADVDGGFEAHKVEDGWNCRKLQDAYGSGCDSFESLQWRRFPGAVQTLL